MEDGSIDFTLNINKLKHRTGGKLVSRAYAKKTTARRKGTDLEKTLEYERSLAMWADLAKAPEGLLTFRFQEESDTVFDFGGGRAHTNSRKKFDASRQHKPTGYKEEALAEEYDYAIELIGIPEYFGISKDTGVEETPAAHEDIVEEYAAEPEEPEEEFIPGPPAYTFEEYEEEEKSFGRGETEWRRVQRKRWEEGHTGKSGVRLTGIHYFYLTQIWIKDGTGRMIRPIWRDVDSMIFEAYEECLRLGKDLAIFKRREVGLSSIFGAAIPIWTTIMFPGSTSLMTSADKARVVDMYDEKFMCSLNALDEWIRPKQKKSDNKEGVAVFEVKDEMLRASKDMSKMRCRQTSQDRKDSTNLEGSRAKYAFIDELFLHPYAEDVRGSVESCLMSGFDKIGICVFGGSAGHISRAGIRQAEQTWADRENGSVTCIFIPGTLGILAAPVLDDDGKPTGEKISFCVNGHSDTKAAKRWIMQKRAQLAQLKNKTHLASFIKRYPISIEEVFGASELGALPPEIKEMVVERNRELMNNPVTVKRKKVVPLSMENYRMEDDRDGAWVVYEDPIPGEKYIMGSDPIPMIDIDKIDVISPDDTSLSLFGCCIKRLSTNTYVAVYQRRNLNPDTVFTDVFGAQMIYNGCKNMLERNRSDMLIDRYRAHGKWDYLADQPTFWTKKAYKVQAKKGWYKGTDNTEIAYGKFFDYLRDNMDRIMFKEEIIDKLPVFILENTDVLDAMVSCELYHEQIRRTSATSQATLAGRIKYREMPYTTHEGGRRVTRYRKVPVFSNSQDEADYHERMRYSAVTLSGSGAVGRV
jgi:hypothetical protein